MLFRTLQLCCAVFFLFDVSYELFDFWRTGFDNDYLHVTHLMFEVLAVAFLLSAFRISQRYEAALRGYGDRGQRTLSALRGQFDGLLNAKFDEWGLSAAERDVALLSFRGLRIAEIAEARGTREGTVKAQLSAIFHKAGVRTKAEFMAQFMDVFLDFAADDDDVQIPATAG